MRRGSLFFLPGLTMQNAGKWDADRKLLSPAGDSAATPLQHRFYRGSAIAVKGVAQWKQRHKVCQFKTVLDNRYSPSYHKNISATLVGEHIYSPRKGALLFAMPDCKVAVLIDGGFLRVIAKKAKKLYDPEYIEKCAHACRAMDESIFRILYYDCALYQGTVKQPVSGTDLIFNSSDAWLQTLSQKNLFAVRRGVLKFRGFKPKKTPVNPTQLTDADFEPIFEQKGVDMRIGLDIAAYSDNHAVDRIILVTGDTDCVPALKYGRRAGLQTVLIQPVGEKIAPELIAHSDFKRTLNLP